jgi:hypothetical protein
MSEEKLCHLIRKALGKYGEKLPPDLRNYFKTTYRRPSVPLSTIKNDIKTLGDYGIVVDYGY